MNTEPVRTITATDEDVVELHGIALSRSWIAEFCRRHHVRSFALFGSILRDDFGPESDIDVLVEFEPGKTPGLGVLRDAGRADRSVRAAGGPEYAGLPEHVTSATEVVGRGVPALWHPLRDDRSAAHARRRRARP